MTEERKLETTVSKNIGSKRSAQFLAAIPWSWICVAANGPGKTLHVALAIRHQSKLEKNKTISLGSRFLDELGVSKDAKARGLVYLEEKGLIRSEQKTGSNPRITVLDI